jgi:hypothetical protein
MDLPFYITRACKSRLQPCTLPVGPAARSIAIAWAIRADGSLTRIPHSRREFVALASWPAVLRASWPSEASTSLGLRPIAHSV